LSEEPERELGDVKGLSLRQIKKMEFKVAKENAFFKINKVYKYFPTITGMPRIKAKEKNLFMGKSMFYSKKSVGIHRSPRYCHIRKIVNHSWYKLGAPQICVVGTLGTGKSNLITFITAMLAARGVRILTFNDTCFEARSLAAHGWYDNNAKFHPFQLNVWVPEGYEFRKTRAHNPIWEHRDNVNLCEFEEIDQIFDSMSRGVITVVYDDCYTPAGKLRLLIDLFKGQADRMSLKVNNMFVHHELSTLIPEGATKELWKLVQEFSDVLVTSRRNRLGILTSFHIPTEVFYRTVQKFSYVLFKRPTNRSNMTAVELASRKLAINEVNVSRGGYWMKHEIGYFPELPDIYRIVPQREKIDYPDLEPKNDEVVQKKEIDPINFAICQLRGQGYSWKDVAERVGLAKATVIERGHKLGLTGRGLKAVSR